MQQKHRWTVLLLLLLLLLPLLLLLLLLLLLESGSRFFAGCGRSQRSQGKT